MHTWLNTYRTGRPALALACLLQTLQIMFLASQWSREVLSLEAGVLVEYIAGYHWKVMHHSLLFPISVRQILPASECCELKLPLAVLTKRGDTC